MSSFFICLCFNFLVPIKQYLIFKKGKEEGAFLQTWPSHSPSNHQMATPQPKNYRLVH